MHKKRDDESFRDLIFGILFAILSVIIIVDQSLQIIVKPRLYDGSLNDRGRYAMIFDAYDVIENDDSDSIIFLGSSKMREAINGNLIEQINGDGVNIYNLGYAGERPYYRMIEIEQIIQAKPEIVVLELGPNSFSKTITPLTEQSLWKMRQLVSLSGKPAPQSMYYSQLTEHDKTLLPSSNIEIADNLSAHFRQSIELTSAYHLDYEEKRWDCNIDVQCAPYFKHDDFEQYLEYPTQFPNWLAQYRESNRTEILEKVNFISPYVELPKKLTVEENLKVYGKMYGVNNLKDKILDLMKQLNLLEFGKRKTGELSSGQKNRVSLAKALINDPEILLLDEPTASLDPDVGDYIRTYIEDFASKKGTTILLASHNMNEVERLCNEVMMMKNGEIIDKGTCKSLINKHGRKNLEETFLKIVRE